MTECAHTAKTLSEWEIVRSWVRESAVRRVEVRPFNDRGALAVVVYNGSAFEHEMLEDDENPWIVAWRVIMRLALDVQTPSPVTVSGKD